MVTPYQEKGLNYPFAPLIKQGRFLNREGPHGLWTHHSPHSCSLGHVPQLCSLPHNSHVNESWPCLCPWMILPLPKACGAKLEQWIIQRSHSRNFIYFASKRQNKSSRYLFLRTSFIPQIKQWGGRAGALTQRAPHTGFSAHHQKMRTLI